MRKFQKQKYSNYSGSMEILLICIIFWSKISTYFGKNLLHLVIINDSLTVYDNLEDLICGNISLALGDEIYILVSTNYAE